MKPLILFIFSLLISSPLFSQTWAYHDDFEDGSLDTTRNETRYTLWKADHPEIYGLSENNGVLSIEYLRSAESYIWGNFNFTSPDSIDVSQNPLITLKIKSDVACAFNVKPGYTNGSNGWLPNSIPADNAWHEYSFQLVEANYSGTYLEIIHFYFDGGSSSPKSGTVQFDDFQVAGITIPVIHLKARMIDSSKVDLSWENSDPANTEHFNIYRNHESGFIAGEAFKIAETTDGIYHDSGLINNSTYYYQVSVTDLEATEHSPSGVSIRTFTPGAAPGLEVVSENANPVASYEKFEIVVGMKNASYGNPYNPDEIDLHAWFMLPGAIQ